MNNEACYLQSHTHVRINIKRPHYQVLGIVLAHKCNGFIRVVCSIIDQLYVLLLIDAQSARVARASALA